MGVREGLSFPSSAYTRLSRGVWAIPAQCVNSVLYTAGEKAVQGLSHVCIPALPWLLCNTVSHTGVAKGPGGWPYTSCAAFNCTSTGSVTSFVLLLSRVTGGELFEDIVAREYYSEADAR